MSHTEEPWSIDEYGRVKADGCNEFLGVQVDGFSLNGGEESKANARRIVACINACAGVSTEYLEGFAVGVNATGIPMDKVIELSNNERDQLRELCCDLLETLNKINEWKEFPATGIYWDSGNEMCYETCYGSNGARDYMRNIAKQAITKAESILGEKNGR